MEINIKDFPYEYIHSLANHNNGCNGVAFYYSCMPRLGDCVKAKDAISVNGETPKNGDDIVCNTCGVRLSNLTIASIRKRT